MTRSLTLLSLAIAAIAALAVGPAPGTHAEEPLGEQEYALTHFTESQPAASEHPLLPILQWARAGHQRIVENVHDYTCVFVKRVRIDGELREPQMLFAKVRHETSASEAASERESGRKPFSLYMKFQSPTSIRGRELLFLKHGQDDKLLVRNGGRRLAFLTARIEPTSRLAMRGNRYPVTEFGIKRLVERMIEQGEKEMAFNDCGVTIDADVQLHERSCTRIEICHPQRRKQLNYHLARIYVDNHLHLPIRFESYDWPQEDSDEPVLNEEYTYYDLKLNVNLTDADFDPGNSEYAFAVAGDDSAADDSAATALNN